MLSWWYDIEALSAPVLAPVLGPFLPDHLLWYSGATALAALIYTAWVDAKQGIVPPTPIALASGVVLIDLAFRHTSTLHIWLIPAFLFFAAIWALNMIWRRMFRQDALGMGDASWSFLATLIYGWRAVVFAWGAGAILGLLYMGWHRLRRRRKAHIHFAPFLLVALLAVVGVPHLVGQHWPELAQRFHIQ